MNAKIKYSVDGLGEVEVEVDSADIQDKNGQSEYRALHKFLTGVLSGTPAQDEEVRDTTAKDESRPHNKSLPHFKADRRLAKIIIDKGGLKFLHGVNVINKKQVFFFDRVPTVQDIIERYNMQDSTAPVPAESGQAAKKKSKKSNKKQPQKKADNQTVVEQPQAEHPVAPDEAVNDVASCETVENISTPIGSDVQ